MKIIYAGTPQFAVPALESLLQSRHEVVAVYTQPDRPAGRGRKLQLSPVKKCALNSRIAVFQPASFAEKNALPELQALQSDLMVVAAYGLLLPQSVLDTPAYGCINIHASLLPRWRGAAPIQTAILAGDAQTGITIMQMNQGLDTGDILAKSAISIKPHWSAADLQDELSRLGASLLLSTLDNFEACRNDATAQNESDMTYAARLTKTQARLDWQKSALTLWREVKAYVPWPVSYTQLEGQTVRIWRAQQTSQLAGPESGLIIEHNKSGIFVNCRDRVLQVTELQFAGKKIITAAAALNARNLRGLSFA